MPSNIDSSLTRNFKFGVGDPDAPSLGMLATTGASLVWEPEVYAKAPDGEGHSIALARSEAKVSGTFTGYVSDTEFAAPFSFSFLGITFIVKSSSRPRPKGQFMEVTVEAEGYQGLP
jgi:hypothetical protein